MNTATGGYHSLSLTDRSKQLDVEEWLANGLMRHIEVWSEAPIHVWEGFVDSITASLGSLSFTLGPVTQIANRVSIIYSPVDTSTDPPAVGITTDTVIVENIDSQARYGIWPVILTAGTTTLTDAEEYANSYLNHHAWPVATRQVNTEGNDVSITIDCLGYFHMLNYPYAAVGPGTQDASAKIDAIVNNTSNPNSSWLPFNRTFIDSSNTLQVIQAEDQNRLASNIIKEIAALGDISDNRWLFGVYNHREIHYHAAPTDVRYRMHLSDPKVRITDEGAEVAPCAIVAGEWLKFLDFALGQEAISLRQDPRSMFIETATYRAPWSLDLQGGNVDTVRQILAQETNFEGLWA
ncbi:MAG: hypothetical protein ABIG63_15075 [Chloroflexota bacterium]